MYRCGMGCMVVILQQKVIKMSSPLQVGKNYLCQEWKQELITFSEFLEKIQSNDSSSAVPTYLAQHQLFDQVGCTHLPMGFNTLKYASS
jgi:hypothetical protein